MNSIFCVRNYFVSTFRWITYKSEIWEPLQLSFSHKWISAEASLVRRVAGERKKIKNACLIMSFFLSIFIGIAVGACRQEKVLIIVLSLLYCSGSTRQWKQYLSESSWANPKTEEYKKKEDTSTLKSCWLWWYCGCLWFLSNHFWVFRNVDFFAISFLQASCIVVREKLF